MTGPGFYLVSLVWRDDNVTINLTYLALRYTTERNQIPIRCQQILREIQKMFLKLSSVSENT